MRPENADDPLRTGDRVTDVSATAPTQSLDSNLLAKPSDSTPVTPESTGVDQSATAESGMPVSPCLDAGMPTVPGYEILGVLGRGGMGVVYKARHIKLKRIVALKMILAGAHAGPKELERFRLEAEAVATPQHPPPVQIHEAGGHDGKPDFPCEF